MKDAHSEKEKGLDEGYEAGVKDAKEKAIEIVRDTLPIGEDRAVLIDRFRREIK